MFTKEIEILIDVKPISFKAVPLNEITCRAQVSSRLRGCSMCGQLESQKLQTQEGLAHCS